MSIEINDDLRQTLDELVDEYGHDPIIVRMLEKVGTRGVVIAAIQWVKNQKPDWSHEQAVQFVCGEIWLNRK